MRAAPTALAILAGSLVACAAKAPPHAQPRPALAAPAAQVAPAPAPPPGRCGPTPGMDAAAVRRCWGGPDLVERHASAAAPGVHYERWSYRTPPGGDGTNPADVWFADGKVTDITGTLVQP